MKDRASETSLLKLLRTWRTEPVDPGLLGVNNQGQLQHVAKTLRGTAKQPEEQCASRRDGDLQPRKPEGRLAAKDR